MATRRNGDYHWGDAVAEGVATRSELVLGIDPVYEEMPRAFRTGGSIAEEIEAYVTFVLERGAPKIAFVKFQAAFFEAIGSSGVRVLAASIARARALGYATILDAKRGDIGSTAAAYARAYLVPDGSDLEVDCLTVSPYLGKDSVVPFVECAARFGKGIFLLTQTSNAGSPWLQGDGSNEDDGAIKVAKLIGEASRSTVGSAGLSAVGAVIGATFGERGALYRPHMPDSIVLAPGVGAQGATIDQLRRLRRTDGSGLLVPVSRGITSADVMISRDGYADLLTSRIGELSNVLLAEAGRL